MPNKKVCIFNSFVGKPQGGVWKPNEAVDADVVEGAQRGLVQSLLDRGAVTVSDGANSPASPDDPALIDVSALIEEANTTTEQEKPDEPASSDAATTSAQEDEATADAAAGDGTAASAGAHTRESLEALPYDKLKALALEVLGEDHPVIPAEIIAAILTKQGA